MPKQLPDTLDLVRQGPKQIDSVRVWSGNPNTSAEDDVTGHFLNAINSFTNAAGNKLGAWADERKKLQLQKEDTWARLKATNPVEFQKRLATGEAKESDHPGFVSKFNVYDARARSQEAQAEFAAFDVQGADDAQVAEFAANTEKKYLGANPSIEYQGAISESLGTLKADLTSRRAQFVTAQHRDIADLNLGATINGSVRDAVSQGRLAEIGPTLDTLLAQGVAHGDSASKIVNMIQASLVSAVEADPHSADMLSQIALPTLGGTSIGNLMGDKLMDVQSKAVRAAHVERREARKEQREQDKLAVKEVENQATRESLSPTGLTPETAQQLMATSPTFVAKLSKINDSVTNLVEQSPGYKKFRSGVILGAPGHGQDDIDAALAADQFGPKQHAELSANAKSAEQRGDVMKRPEYDLHSKEVTRVFDNLMKAVAPPSGKDPVSGLSIGGLSYNASFAIEEARSRVTAGFRSTASAMIDSGVEPQKAFAAAAQDAREEAMLEIDSIAARHKLGNHANDVDEDGAGQIIHSKRPPVNPSIIREANDKLDPTGIFGLDRLGGFHSIADKNTFVKAGEALGVLGATDKITPWAATAYLKYMRENPDAPMDERQFVYAIFYASHPSLPVSLGKTAESSDPANAPKLPSATKSFDPAENTVVPKKPFELSDLAGQPSGY